MENNNEFGFDADLFERVCQNALNGITRDDLTEEEWEIHRQWVVDHWVDLNAGIED